MTKNAFLCLLPSKEDSARLYDRLDNAFSLQTFPYVKLPLHMTLYYFPVLTHANIIKVMSWMQTTAKKNKGPVSGSIGQVECFPKNNQDFVYYLPVRARKIVGLHNEIYEIFEDIYADHFEFIPHLSLFYPQKDLNEKEKKIVKDIFKGLHSIMFDRLAFAVERNGGRHYLDIQTI